MATIKKYGVTAVLFSRTSKHHHYISHVFVHEVYEDDTMKIKGELITKDVAIELIKNTPFYTFIWDYKLPAKWRWGAQIDIEVVGGITYLRTLPDNSTKNNLADLLEYQYF